MTAAAPLIARLLCDRCGRCPLPPLRPHDAVCTCRDAAALADEVARRHRHATERSRQRAHMARWVAAQDRRAEQ